ncbi:DUF302 domain-containing protein [Dyella soli]|uniref:DUF302 domain-containing protein n=1 Tax=Dyella soli TaxID=522319 RepID=A0A4R0YS69_9GAMM|nr:DUF302 domain-containing protein [Dyella soli]TCI09004.1 DUF302 domain-containing protein [Dyella soli]
MSSDQDVEGVVRFRAASDVPTTVDRLRQLLEAHGLTIFALIDFSGDAARAGLSMCQQQMLIFGNPRGGTPLMQAAPTVGLDLPLKVLVWEDAQGVTWVGYNAPEYIVARHGLPPAMASALAGAVALLRQVAG